jgi:uncharacterized protein YndB with AHSA1/START domain
MLARNDAALVLTLPSDREIVLSRVFSAPRRLVFEAWTKPEHVKQWYGCSIMTLPVCEIDLRVGGAYRYVMRDPAGAAHTMRGIYREIVRPERLVYTQQYVTEGFTSGEALVTVLLAEHGGMTTLTNTILHRSREDRDAHLSTGMEKGVAEMLGRLDDHIAAMA